MSTLFARRIRSLGCKLLRCIGCEMGKVIPARSIHYSRDNMGMTDALNANIHSICAELIESDFGQMKKQNIVPASGVHFQSGTCGAIDVLRLFKSMVSDDSTINEDKCVLVVTSCVEVGYVLFGRQCHGYLLKSGLVLKRKVKSALLLLYQMLSDVVGALDVLFSLSGSDSDSDNPATYPLVLGRLLGENCYMFLDDEFKILTKMFASEDDHMMWNKASYLGIIGLCARVRYRRLGRQVHTKLLKSSTTDHDDVSVCNALLKMYAACGDLSGAISVLHAFKAARNVDVHSYTLAMALVSQKGFFEILFLYFRDMRHYDNNIAPNEYVICVLLNASAELFSLTHGTSLHALADKTGFEGHKKVKNNLINMYFRTGDIKSAQKVFLSMSTYNRDIITLNGVISGYCLHGYHKEALSLFEEMLESSGGKVVVPNGDTFVPVLHACGRLGRVMQGFRILHEVMKRFGVEPDRLHYRCAMKMPIRVGNVLEAFNFMASTPAIKYDRTAWVTLLRATGGHIRTELSELLPYEIPGEYLREWFGFAHVDELIQGLENDINVNNSTRVKEEPGMMSWVQVKNTRYKFVSCVNGDPKFVKHHKRLKPFFASIYRGEEEYDPGTGTGNNNNNDVEDDHEGTCDGYHSEKLAVACALLEGHKSAPIIIIKKTGKICDDCHSLMKLISKVRKRLITVADFTGFHHFQDGSCSCRDCWYLD